MINLDWKDSVKQNRSLSMFFKKCTNQNLGYSFKLQICSNFGPVYFIERQMIDGRKNATKNPWAPGEMSALKSYFKNNISSLTVPGKTMVEDARRVVKAKVHNLIVNGRKKK